MPDELGLPRRGVAANGTAGFHDRVEAFRTTLILEALDAAGGKQTRAARSLGLAYHQFRYFYRKVRSG